MSEFFKSNSSHSIGSIFSDEHKTRNLQKMSRHKRLTRLAVLAFVFAAVGLVLITYFLLKSRQDAQFETAFQIYAHQTALIADHRAETAFGQLQSLASSVRTLTLGDADDNMAYPQEVTLPAFDMRAEEISNLTGIEMLMFVPFVPNEQRGHWEEYQSKNQQWIEDGFSYRGWDLDHFWRAPRKIHNYTQAYNESRTGFVDNAFTEEILGNHTSVTNGCAVPVAQAGPRLSHPSLVMLDLFTHPIFRKEIVTSLEYDVPVISEPEDLEFLLEHFEPEGPSGTEWDFSLPRSFTLDQVKESYEPASKTLGFIVGILQWDVFFKGFLPDDVNGVNVKVVSDCGRNFTYIVNGGREDEWSIDKAEFKPKYLHLEKQYQFFFKIHPTGTSRHCHYDLHITPTDEFADQYYNNTPIILAMCAFSFLVFSALIFWIYDKYNYNQQKRITMGKQQAEAVVSSLFPKNVGHALMQEHALDDAIDTGNKDVESQVIDPSTKKRTKPLAELYPSATIYFADLVGFTAWSSNRDPAEVFTLLETLYGEFDAIARKRKVFKVETIGDCYVAVCGLPDPNKKHAVTMARFAKDCLNKFTSVVAELEHELPGAGSLGLRTGLHSGPVTAGVLRGERARFQLFGDTVNTTARHESTGEGGRIHVSKEFRDELIKYEKSHWLDRRKDKVQAKGKGTLETFWLKIKDTLAIDEVATQPKRESSEATLVTEQEKHYK